MDFLGLRHLRQSFACAFQGVREAFREVAFRQELAIGAVALPAAWLAPGLDFFWRVFLTLCWLSLPTMEIVNTAIENAANMLSPEQNPLAKKAKDLAGAGVLFVCIGNTIAWGSAIYVVVRHLLAS